MDGKRLCEDRKKKKKVFEEIGVKIVWFLLFVCLGLVCVWCVFSWRVSAACAAQGLRGSAYASAVLPTDCGQTLRHLTHLTIGPSNPSDHLTISSTSNTRRHLTSESSARVTIICDFYCVSRGESSMSDTLTARSNSKLLADWRSLFPSRSRTLPPFGGHLDRLPRSIEEGSGGEVLKRNSSTIKALVLSSFIDPYLTEYTPSHSQTADRRRRILSAVVPVHVFMHVFMPAFMPVVMVLVSVMIFMSVVVVVHVVVVVVHVLAHVRSAEGRTCGSAQEAGGVFDLRAGGGGGVSKSKSKNERNVPSCSSSSASANGESDFKRHSHQRKKQKTLLCPSVSLTTKTTPAKPPFT